MRMRPRLSALIWVPCLAAVIGWTAVAAAETGDLFGISDNSIYEMSADLVQWEQFSEFGGLDIAAAVSGDVYAVGAWVGGVRPIVRYSSTGVYVGRSPDVSFMNQFNAVDVGLDGSVYGISDDNIYEMSAELVQWELFHDFGALDIAAAVSGDVYTVGDSGGDGPIFRYDSDGVYIGRSPNVSFMNHFNAVDVVVPEPATLSLLALGAVAVLRRRSRGTSLAGRFRTVAGQRADPGRA